MIGDTLYLRPRLGERLGSLLESPALLHTLADALGSPLAVVLPEQIAENVEAFRAVFRLHHLGGRLYYAHKANRSSALLRQLATTAAGVDVASLGELQHALSCGFTGERIVATGPKNPAFLWLAARAEATVALDSPGELEQLAAIVRAQRLPRVKVLPRLSGFRTGGVRTLSRPSRFGTPAGELDALLKALDRHADAVEMTGVSYHLDTTAVGEKAAALEGCLTVLEECRSRGLRPRALDIGGGFGVNYLARAEQWERWTSELSRAVLGSRAPMAWGGHGYGLRAEAGTVRGSLGLYPAHRPVAGPSYLDDLLSQPAASFGARPLAALLLEHLYDLYAEPGRALLDQCGLTLARVLEVRPATGGLLWVRVEANAHDLGLEEHGVLLDPVLLPRRGHHEGEPGEPVPGEPVAVHLFGNLCLEADLITRRIVHLPHRPRPGDLLAFANTAGYCMDFHATRAQRQPVARKVAAWHDGSGWCWCLDEEYWPTSSRQPEGEQ